MMVFLVNRFSTLAGTDILLKTLTIIDRIFKSTMFLNVTILNR